MAKISSSEDAIDGYLSRFVWIPKLARQSPTVFILDDLHWADQPSLDLFAYLAFALADHDSVPLLLLGTHRPVEPEHPIARLVNRFEREPLYRSPVLPGLDEAELRELLMHLGLPRPSHQLLSTIHHVTHGLPLFIQEIVNHLMQKGVLQERRGYLVANHASMAMIQLPKDIQSAFTIRVKDASKTCRQTLSMAAVLGEQFSLERLKMISDLHAEELLDALEEGLHQGLLVEEEEGFQFAHALIRQAFYKGLSAIRRRRIRLKIAQALEQVYETNLDEYLLEIAYHLIEARELADSSQLLDYARKAGHQAFSIFAWSDAARYYEAALAAAEVLDTVTSAQDMADLHYLAGLSHYRNTDVGPVLDHYDKAIDLYRVSGCIQGLAQTLVEQTVTHITLSSVPLETLANLQPLQDML